MAGIALEKALQLVQVCALPHTSQLLGACGHTHTTTCLHIITHSCILLITKHQEVIALIE